MTDLVAVQVQSPPVFVCRRSTPDIPPPPDRTLHDVDVQCDTVASCETATQTEDVTILDDLRRACDYFCARVRMIRLPCHVVGNINLF